MGRVRGGGDRLRVLDACLNRAREGARVLEDVARFVLNDGACAGELKAFRHLLDRLSRPLYPKLLEARDSRHDVGRRGGLRDVEGRGWDAVVASNLRRVEEAARTIEEVARGEENELARAAGLFRYRCYDLERELVPRAWRRGRIEEIRLYALVDPSVAPLSRAQEAVAGGVEMLQLRHKGATARQLRSEIRGLRRLGVPVIVNDRVDLAGDVDGVHLGREDLSISEARRILGERKIIGVTSHSLAEAKRAVRAGADYISVGPMFATTLKPKLPPRGFSYLVAARKLGVPVFCIGGIDKENIRETVRRGADRVAVCQGIFSQGDPRKAAARLRSALPE